MKAPEDPIQISKFTAAEAIKGSMQFQAASDKLMHAVLENDKKSIEEGKIVEQILNQSLGSFTPDLLMENIVQDYSGAKQLYGPKLLRLLTGFDDGYIEKNLQIPEFQKEVRNRLEKRMKELQEENLLDVSPS